MRALSLVLPLLLAMPVTSGCVSTATYEKDLADARAEGRAAQQASLMHIEALRMTIEAMQRSMMAEAELRVVHMRALEAQLQRLDSEQKQQAVGATPVSSSGEASRLREELVRMKQQDELATARIKRLEETIQKLSRRTSGIPSVDLDVTNPWNKLHEYPY